MLPSQTRGRSIRHIHKIPLLCALLSFALAGIAHAPFTHAPVTIVVAGGGIFAPPPPSANRLISIARVNEWFFRRRSRSEATGMGAHKCCLRHKRVSPLAVRTEPRFASYGAHGHPQSRHDHAQGIFPFFTTRAPNFSPPPNTPPARTSGGSDHIPRPPPSGTNGQWLI